MYIFRQQGNFAAFYDMLDTAGKAMPVQKLKVEEVEASI